VSASKSSAANTIDIHLVLTLIPTDSPIVPYDAALHGGTYDTAHPLLKVVFRHPEEAAPAIPFGYAAWKDVPVSSLELNAEVQGVKNLLVQNDIGSIEPSKPFRPFGLQPVVGSHCYIGHPEVFRQPLSSLDLDLTWKDAPSDLNDYYKLYAEVTNESFTAHVSILEDFQWEPLTEDEPKALFAADGKPMVNMSLTSGNLAFLSRKADTIGDQEWGFEVPNSYLRLTLAEPSVEGLSAFGHTNYAALVAANQGTEIVPVPYTPLLAQISLNYTTAKVTWSPGQNSAAFESLLQVNPFGADALPAAQQEQLFPQYTAEGYFYLGLQSLNLPQSVHLLFQMEEGTGDSDTDLLDTQVSWSYLSGAVWKPLERFRVSKDTTNGLLNSG
ncbi:MAG TPA: hypothetical protein DCE41_15645, partial [Cytophagales bacterium]|nr:hypothetical protein [Cytophagales bacterium]